jgi:protein-disulfide isomerase
MIHPSTASAKAAPDPRRALFPGARLLAVAALSLLGSTACTGEAEAPGALDRAATLARFSNIPQRGVFLGEAAAPVTLTIFVDLQCHFCRIFAERVEPSLVEDYARTGKVRLVFRNLAFLGPESRKAARMAGAVGLQDHLWQFTNLLFAAPTQENSGDLSDTFLRRMAEAIPRVDVDRAVADSGSNAVTAQLVAAQHEAEQFGIHAAPTFLLGKTGSAPEVLHVDRLAPEAFAGPIDALLPPG